MPYKSDAQRKFFHAAEERGEISPQVVSEFDKASEGKDLPEHAKKMAEGGHVEPDRNEPGLQDATTSDFLLPYLLGPTTKLAAMGKALPAVEEAGAAALKQAAPIMGDAIEGATTRDIVSKLEPSLIGVQKGAKGSPGVELWKVKGDPEEIAKLGFGPDPASIPKNILQDKGILPMSTRVPLQTAPNQYAEGGYAEGGYPHVSFLENESPEQVKKDTHMEGAPAGPANMTETGEKENPVHMSEGGKTPHFLEGLKKGALHKELGVSEDKNIPEKKLEHAASSDDETLRKRAQFAINAKKWHHADGGVIPPANKEPEKPNLTGLSHEAKMKEIYKAMGVKKYADGGAVDAPPVGPQITPPNLADPTYWDQIKAALAQVTAPLSGAASALTTPLQAAGRAAMPLIPPAVSAVNKLTGASFPVPTPPMANAPATPPALPPASAPAPSPAAAPTMPSAVVRQKDSTAAGDMPNLKTIFNQDTSKLTQGVNAEDRQALANKLQEQQHGIGSIIAQAVSGLGDALAAKGGREQHSLQGIFSMQKTQRDEALANFDKARQDRLEKLQMQTQMGDNALKQAAAADAYGVDENLNRLVGAPRGTMHKDLNTYFQLKAAQVAQQEKDADLYMKAHSQAASEVDAAVKNASVLGIKPSAAQLQASGAKLADHYYNRAKGNILVKPSDGGPAQWIPAGNIGKARQMDPNLQIQP